MANKIYELIRIIFVKILIFPIRVYQYVISPLTSRSCRHIPTCSAYSIEALKVHGVIKGTYLAVTRVLRCNPWGTFGYDPVPAPASKIKKSKKG
jgi:uncharacterized protein